MIVVDQLCLFTVQAVIGWHTKVDKSINNFVWLCWKARRKQIHTQRAQQQHTHNHYVLMHVDMFVGDSYTYAKNEIDNVCEQLV